MTVNVLIGVSLFGAGGFYVQHDWIRFAAMLVVGLLIWVLRDELRSRA